MFINSLTSTAGLQHPQPANGENVNHLNIRRPEQVALDVLLSLNPESPKRVGKRQREETPIFNGTVPQNYTGRAKIPIKESM